MKLNVLFPDLQTKHKVPGYTKFNVFLNIFICLSYYFQGFLYSGIGYCYKQTLVNFFGLSEVKGIL